MEPSVVVENARVFLGDCREVLKTLPDNSVDSVVTDPPYELGFMGKKWDSSGIAYDVTVWEECLRVLKPGGHILAFGGTRTWHRLAVAIEDAGFEIRDNIAWMYGSGFPKSLDVSKAIDKRRDETTDKARVALELRNALLRSGKNRREIDEHFGTANVSQYWFSAERNAQIVPADKWPWVRDWLGIGGELDAEVWRLNGRKGKPGENWDQREVIGRSDELYGRKSGIGNGVKGHTTVGGTIAEAYDVTAPSTPEAQKWRQ